MGLNTPMVVMNDLLHEIENDPDFGRKVSRAVQDGRHGRHHSSFAVLPSSHSSGYALVAVGGNMIRYIGSTLSYLESDQADAVHRARIDAAAKHLRETHGAGKNLTPWDLTPRSTKKKWLALAESTLAAADFVVAEDGGATP